MAFLKEVGEGHWGVQIAIPDRLTLVDEGKGSAELIDRARRVIWQVSRSGYRLDLSPEHQDLLERDIERHTRDLFDRFHRDHVAKAESPLGSDRPPRTQDAAWSPVVSVERVRIQEHDALSVIHRMSYAPGDERIMGHVLVPVRSGLFEIRILAQAQMTGLRESVLFDKARRGGERPEDVMKRLRQRDIDDPSVDALFVEHPLSLVRAELRELLEGDGIKVLEPVSAAPSGEVILAEVDCAVTPPPRYVRMADDREGSARFSRVSFAGSEGVQILGVTRVSDKSIPLRRRRKTLLTLAEAVTHLPRDVTEIHREVRSFDVGGRAHAAAYRAYDPSGGTAPEHTASRFFTDDKGRSMWVTVGTARCVPKEELFDEVESVVASWRPLDDGGSSRDRAWPEQKPWWRWW